VPRTADPESRTPAFKSVVVTVGAQKAEAKRVSLQIAGQFDNHSSVRESRAC
jgi:hypothetical protein